MTKGYPIPLAALDDRLGWVGTSGSGKTYNASAGVEMLLAAGQRAIIPDPLGVWWGLALRDTGPRPSVWRERKQLVIFGGPHGDIPLVEGAGALIGETVATMTESVVLDLSDLGTKAAERRFMLAFLTALYRHASREPVHVIFDEADLWAPQMVLDKDGEALKLKGMMEQIVRRGRIKGFIPWLITQRPAVVSKDVLSQVDGLIAFTLTSSQDRDALGAWIEGQADRAQGREILASLPSLQIGTGVVWVPRRGVLTTSDFPKKTTFDSSRTPARGERRETRDIKPLNLEGLRGKLDALEADAKANDPKSLKAEIARLTRELTAAQRAVGAPPKPVTVVANADAIAAARAEGERAGMTIGIARAQAALKNLRVDAPTAPTPTGAKPATKAPAVTASPAPPAPTFEGGSASLSGPQRQMLGAIAWWKHMGHENPSKPQVAAICGWKVTSGHLKNVAGGLRSAGLIDYPSAGQFRLTETGEAAAPAPDTSVDFHDALRSTLTGPQRMVFDALLEKGDTMSRQELAIACGWEPTSGHVKNVLGSLRTLEIIDYPAAGQVALQSWAANK